MGAKIEKFTEEEMIQWLEDRGYSTLDEDWPQYFRYCSHCRCYVFVDDHNGEDEICDQCDSNA
jgi:hypothetical protein